MHIRDQRNSNNFHGYKKIDLIINSKFIDPNKHTAKELHHMDLQETIVLRIQRERGEAIQLLTTDPKVYKELLMHHRRGTNGGGEPHPRWCLDWIWWFWTLRRLDEYFVDFPRVLGILGYLQSKEAVRGHPRWAQPTRARLGLVAHPGGLCSPRGTPKAQPGPAVFLLAHKNHRGVSRHLDFI